MSQPTDRPYSSMSRGKRMGMELEQFPEELIDRIMFFLQPQSSLAAAVLTSRKLNRIATPYLYAAVSLTVCMSGQTVKTLLEDPMDSLNLISVTHDSTTFDKCNISHFISTIMRRPDFRLHVRYLQLLRRDSGTVSGAAASYRRPREPPRLSNIMRAATGRAVDLGHVRETVLIDPAKDAVQAVLRMLPNIHYLDCSGYRTDVPVHAVLRGISYSAGFATDPHNFEHLRTFKLDCSTEDFFAQLWAVFTLPNLESLCIVGLQLSPHLAYAVIALGSKWVGLGPSCSVTKVEILDVVQTPITEIVSPLPFVQTFVPDADSPLPVVLPMAVLFSTCRQLKSLTVTSLSPGLLRILQGNFGKYFDDIEGLDSRETS